MGFSYYPTIISKTPRKRQGTDASSGSKPKMTKSHTTHVITSCQTEVHVAQNQKHQEVTLLQSKIDYDKLADANLKSRSKQKEQPVQTHKMQHVKH